MKTRITLVAGLHSSSSMRCARDSEVRALGASDATSPTREPLPDQNESSMISLVADGYEMVLHGDAEGRSVHLDFLEDGEWSVGMSYDAATGLFVVTTRSGCANAVLDAPLREAFAANDPRCYGLIRRALRLTPAQATDLSDLVYFDEAFARNAGLPSMEDAPTIVCDRPIVRCGLLGRALAVLRCIAMGGAAARVLARGEVVKIAV